MVHPCGAARPLQTPVLGEFCIRQLLYRQHDAPHYPCPFSPGNTFKNNLILNSSSPTRSFSRHHYSLILPPSSPPSSLQSTSPSLRNSVPGRCCTLYQLRQEGATVLNPALQVRDPRPSAVQGMCAWCHNRLFHFILTFFPRVWACTHILQS